ncbi:MULTISPECIES: hypothetical protein [unclassified Streptomyces]|uniref:hypothetical protein n=1 Tax=unclassified Streptomyces TaxID=2593676 RepID=UPI00136CE1EE|nr:MULTISPECIES: hypothetical protein [unclassified Streptomyces]NEA03705.1 hypothetical protein [Streptomyces sp. SID10116]MYY79689.1 hypothetical protein [Streptomyces sp. SID335]MYZ12837.1 hypothetical protein [Streptomyces sp. SID337]NDZ91141.1 hypothetical protein [Streptomyces sp. SID10115]NEB43538.1 hypothetical protein [Streptomyces sp. SID339]
MSDSSYRTCDRDLQHSGAHEYLGQKWQRLAPALPDPGVEALLEDSLPANAWGIDERRFPIIVTETITRVLWVDAETEDEALAYWADDWTDIPLKDADVIDGSLDFERPDEFQRQEAFEARGHRRHVGPEIACPDCGATSFRRSWFHNPYRKCHGPIAWKVSLGRPMRDWQQTPVHDAARSTEAVA